MGTILQGWQIHQHVLFNILYRWWQNRFALLNILCFVGGSVTGVHDTYSLVRWDQPARRAVAVARTPPRLNSPPSTWSLPPSKSWELLRFNLNNTNHADVHLNSPLQHKPCGCTSELSSAIQTMRAHIWTLLCNTNHTGIHLNSPLKHKPYGHTSELSSATQTMWAHIELSSTNQTIWVFIWTPSATQTTWVFTWTLCLLSAADWKLKSNF